MNQKEFTQKCRDENLTNLYIRYENGFCDKSSILGCTQIDDFWYVYETDEEGNKVIRLISDDENKTFKVFYNYIKRKKESLNWFGKCFLVIMLPREISAIPF